MIFEDAHWTDPTSLEAFGRAVDRIRSLRVLLMVTFRPEFEPPWTGRPHVTANTINRLAQHEAGTMIDCIVGNKLLSASMRKDIIERTDGIPLVRGGDDQGGAGSRGREAQAHELPQFRLRHWRSPQACMPRSWRGSTGSAARQGAGTDRGGNRARVFACLSECRDAQIG